MVVIFGLRYNRNYLLFFYLSRCGTVILCCGLRYFLLVIVINSFYDFDLLSFRSTIIVR